MVQSDGDLSAARVAFTRRDWRVAFDLLWAAEQRSPLDPADLDLLADAAQWVREYDTFLDVLERAEGRYERAGARGDAARVGLVLCREFFKRNRMTEAGAWLRRATRLLKGEPECAAHGHLAWTFGRMAWATEDFDTALAYARDATAIGQRLGDVDLETLGLHDEGHVLLSHGDVDEGRALIDEAAALATGATPNTAGMVYCGAIFAYRNMADWQRASEWTDASLRWCERESLSGFPGLCRFHRAEVRRLHGQLAEAEQDALEAVEELLPANHMSAAWGLAELGEIRRRRGDPAGARAAFQRSRELGGTPQPGLALLQLDEGKKLDAVTGITEALAGMVGVAREDRAAMLPAAVTVALAAERVDLAHAAATELDAWAHLCGTTGTAAAAIGARGEMELVADDTENALVSLRDACRLWCELDAPFEAARARVLIAQALRVDGNESSAVEELETALSTFERLGATNEIAKVRSMLHMSLPTRATPTLMFTDIVDSTKLVELLGDEAWSNLLGWHDRTLRECFSTTGAREINHEGDGFFVSFAEPTGAVRCAVAIQRTLADHRRDHGFAPEVRIGVHATEALDLGDDYLGKGVHEAARIGAAAIGGEILATQAVVDTLDGLYASHDHRHLQLKGLADSVEVASIDWR